MRIACLQFNPQPGKLAQNIVKAEALLESIPPHSLDLLVLPEMALTGYNFLSLEEITPYLEPTAAGVSTDWAKKIARRLNCVVTVGYPESAVAGQGEPVSEDPRAHNFNSTVTVAPDGAVLAHCRKSFLYSTDETWASEGAAGFYSGTLPLCAAPAAAETCRVAMGICMDINPYKFEAPFHKFEFGNHARECGAELVVLSMAWSSFKLTSEEIQDRALEPDLETLSYWVTRFTPLRDDGGTSSSVILVMANRCGSEHETVYAGTSTVMRMTGEQVELWDVLGKGEERCLVVNTEQEPNFRLAMRPR